MSSMEARRLWIPEKRFGEYPLGGAIDLAPVSLQKIEGESDSYWEAYKESECDDIRIYAEDGVIVCIGSYEFFYFGGENLIGLPFAEVVRILNTTYDHSEVQDVIDEQQEVYRFDALSLVVWVKANLVVTIQCSTKVVD